MIHTEEFPLMARVQTGQDDLWNTAAAYSRAFGTEDGKRVLADLLKKFHPEAPRFLGHSDMVKAAKIDGQADVLREITQAIEAGKTFTGIPSPTTP